MNNWRRMRKGRWMRCHLMVRNEHSVIQCALVQERVICVCTHVCMQTSTQLGRLNKQHLDSTKGKKNMPKYSLRADRRKSDVCLCLDKSVKCELRVLWVEVVMCQTYVE